MNRHGFRIATLAGLLLVTAPALAETPHPMPKPPNPAEQAAIDLDALKIERDRRLSQAQTAFQEQVTTANAARDAAIARAREGHDATVAATRAWYESHRDQLERTAKTAATTD